MAESSSLQVRDLLLEGLRLERAVKEAYKSQGDGGVKIAWGVVGSEASTALNGVLDLDVFEVIGRVWCKAKEVRDFADLSKHPSGERSVVYLGQHAFTKATYPTLSVAIGPYTCPPLRFTLELAVTIRSIALSICDGYVTSVGAGDGNVSAQFSYSDIDLSNKQSRKLPLPGDFNFSPPGLPIG